MHETCADADHEISRCQLLGALCLIECDWEPAHVVNMKTSQVSAGPPPQKPIRRPLSSAIKLNAAVSNVFIYQPASFFFWEADVVDALSAAGNPGMAGLYIHTKIYEWIGLVDRWAAPVCVFYPAPECFGRSD